MKRLFLLTVGIILFQLSYAQDEPAPVTISGSVDTYYKYDFSDNENIGTSFGEDQNSFSIGMANLIFSGETGMSQTDVRPPDRIDRRTDGQTDRQASRQTNRQTDKQTDTQTHTHTRTHTRKNTHEHTPIHTNTHT